MNSCTETGKSCRCAYIQVVGGFDYQGPYSVAWISRRLAEPATRVRIAVGPLLSPKSESVSFRFATGALANLSLLRVGEAKIQG